MKLDRIYHLRYLLKVKPSLAIVALLVSMLALITAGATFISKSKEINVTDPEVSTQTQVVIPSQQPTLYKTNSKEVHVEIPPDGFVYNCSVEGANSVQESIVGYHRGVNDQQNCKNILNTTMSNCTNKCNQIWETCKEEILWKAHGYKSKNECVDGEGIRYNQCRDDCLNYMTEELKRCDQFWRIARDKMNALLKQYCEISID